MRRLEELLRQMCQAAKAIGNTDLENKFAAGMIIDMPQHSLFHEQAICCLCRDNEDQERHCVCC